jgi:hypothetical protein
VPTHFYKVVLASGIGKGSQSSSQTSKPAAAPAASMTVGNSLSSITSAGGRVGMKSELIKTSVIGNLPSARM